MKKCRLDSPDRNINNLHFTRQIQLEKLHDRYVTSEFQCQRSLNVVLSCFLQEFETSPHDRHRGKNSPNSLRMRREKRSDIRKNMCMKGYPYCIQDPYYGATLYAECSLDDDEFIRPLSEIFGVHTQPICRQATTLGMVDREI
jgi:hypothetical protein